MDTPESLNARLIELEGSIAGRLTFATTTGERRIKAEVLVANDIARRIWNLLKETNGNHPNSD